MDGEKIIKKLIELEGAMEDKVSNDKFDRFRDEVLAGQDKMITILQRLDEERIFTNKWIGEIEEKVEANKMEIDKMKLRLKVA